MKLQVQACSAAVIFLHMSDQHNLKLWFTNVTCDGKISSQSLQIKVTNWNQIPCDTKLFQLQLKINTCGHLTFLTILLT